MMLQVLLPQNEGMADRVIRVAVGLTLLGLVFFGPQSPWGLIGLIPLVTGLVGSCPLYRLLGMNTGGKDARRAAQ